MNRNTRTNPLPALLLLAIALIAACPAFAANKTYTMKDGDTLWDLSAKYYNDPTLYPVFLEVNNIDNPRMIPVGKVIIIPSFEEMKKVANEPDPAKRQSMVKSLSGGSPIDNGGSSPVKPMNPSDTEDPEEKVAIDAGSVSITNVLGGKKLDPKKVKDDKAEANYDKP
ncbi:MAG TPA: LysM peptidoglycan-binding domain-containing protein [Candidatus Ozemobacteraceae bacterium]|nr:LysM peptidoglycan-binding domain-containing protein [Candidatus Ozemobacteraceae bacterium]